MRELFICVPIISTYVGGWNLDFHKSLSLDGKIFAKKFGSLFLGNNAIKCAIWWDNKLINFKTMLNYIYIDVCMCVFTIYCQFTYLKRSLLEDINTLYK